MHSDHHNYFEDCKLTSGQNLVSMCDGGGGCSHLAIDSEMKNIHMVTAVSTIPLSNDLMHFPRAKLYDEI